MMWLKTLWLYNECTCNSFTQWLLFTHIRVKEMLKEVTTMTLKWILLFSIEWEDCWFECQTKMLVWLGHWKPTSKKDIRSHSWQEKISNSFVWFFLLLMAKIMKNKFPWNPLGFCEIAFDCFITTCLINQPDCRIWVQNWYCCWRKRYQYTYIHTYKYTYKLQALKCYN